MIRPTVGRQVWFRFADYLDRPSNFSMNPPPAGEEPQPCAATVAFVWSDRAINVSVVDHSGNHHNFTSVALRQPGDEQPAAFAWCEWMPFQIGQAAKTESPDYGAAPITLPTAVKVDADGNAVGSTG